jgi:hypothetical protein
VTSLGLLAAIAATLAPLGVADPRLAHRPDPGIDDDDDEEDERPIGDPDEDEGYDDEDDEDDDDDEEPLRVSG